MRLIILPAPILMSASIAFSQPLKDLSAQSATPAAYPRALNTNGVIMACYVADGESQLVRRTESKSSKAASAMYVLRIVNTLLGVTFL